MKYPDMTLLERLTARTPKFFKKVKNLDITLGTIGTVILTAPVSIPAGMITLATYLTVAGTVCASISQTAVEE